MEEAYELRLKLRDGLSKRVDGVDTNSSSPRASRLNLVCWLPVSEVFGGALQKQQIHYTARWTQIDETEPLLC